MSDEGQAPIRKAGWLPRLFTAVLPRVRPFSEMGVSGTPVYAGYTLTPEKSPKLIGQEKYRTFSQILANTTIVAAGVRYFLNIVAKPNWSVEPADTSDQAKELAEFVEEVLFDELHTPWSRIIRRCGTYRFHGFAVQEWTAERRDDGRVGFSDIESRPQWTIWRWEVDERGTVTGCWQRDPLTGRELGLPRGKLMYLVDDTLTDSPEGMGLLRHCVQRAEMLEEYEKQEGFGFLRDLHGVPLGRAPMDEMQQAVAAGKLSQSAMNNAIDTLKKWVSMEKKETNTALILNSQPYMSLTDSGNMITGQMKWGVELLAGGAPGLQFVGGAITRLNQEMARVLGVEHMLLGADAAGSYALAKEKATDLYLLANSVLTDIRLQCEHDLLWPLWSLNGFPDNMMPKLKTEDVSPKDVDQISRVLRDMATAGTPMQPDDEAQNFVRELLGAPTLDLNEMRQRLQDEQNVQAQMQQMQLQQLPDAQAQQEDAQQPPVEKAAWEESKHRRAPKGSDKGGEFVATGAGGGETADKEKQQAGQQGGQAGQGEPPTQRFLKEHSSTVGDEITRWAKQNGVRFAAENAASGIAYYAFTAALRVMFRGAGAAAGLAGGPVGSAVGFVGGSLAAEGAVAMIDYVLDKTKFNFKQAKDMAIHATRKLKELAGYEAEGRKRPINKAEDGAARQNGKGEDGLPPQLQPPPKLDGHAMVNSLDELLHALRNLQPKDLKAQRAKAVQSKTQKILVTAVNELAAIRKQGRDYNGKAVEASRLWDVIAKSATVLEQIEKAGFDPSQLRDQLGRWAGSAASGGAARAKAAVDWLRSKEAGKTLRDVLTSDKAKAAVVATLSGLVSIASQQSDPIRDKVIETHVEHLSTNLGVSKQRAARLLRTVVVALRTARSKVARKRESDEIGQLLGYLEQDIAKADIAADDDGFEITPGNKPIPLSSEPLELPEDGAAGDLFG